jgi:uncharacterized protein YfdQ (DUF2303 family)
MSATTSQPTTAVDHIHLGADTIDRIAELAHASVASQQIGEATFLIVPDKHEARDITKQIESAQSAPNRARGGTLLLSIDSFIQFCKDQGKQSTGYIYAHIDKRQLTAVFNDNKETSIGWRDHTATYTAELSREFLTWFKNNGNGQAKSQEDFAIFLEDNIADIVEPSGEALLTVATSLQAKTEVNFSSAKRLDNGQVQFVYTENVDARAGNGTIEIPRTFALGLKVFKNGDAYRVNARLKYRLHSGTVKFWYELDRVENVIEDAFNHYIDRAKESGYTVLHGTI